MAIQYTNAVQDNQMDEVTAVIDAGSGAGKLRIYDGTPPADANTALSSNTLLADLTLTDPAAGSSSAGVLTLSTITQDSSADATGTASFFRLLDSDLNAVVQGTVATSGGDLNLTTLSIVSGQPVSVSSFTITNNND